MPVEVQKRIKEVDPTQEYLSGGMLSNYFGFPVNFGFTDNMSLFPTNDDVLLKHGFQTYEEMIKDSKVSKCINVIKVGTVADGIEILPSVSESDVNYDKALITKELCNSAVNNLDRPLKETMEELLDALVYGYKIAEVTYEYKDAGGLVRLLPKYIKVKPFGAAKFVVDSKYNIIGIAGASSSYQLKNDLNQAGLVKIADNDIITKDGDNYINTSNGELKFLNRDKFLVLSIRTRDGDPRGTSFIKAAFTPWYLKQQVYPEYLRYLLICAIPLLVGFTPENESIASDIVKDSEGNAVLDSSGSVVRFNPVAALRGALLEARNATALALKGGSEIKEIGNQGNNGIAFYKAIETFNEEIESAILLQTLATSESRYNTRAASQTHMSMLDQLLWAVKGYLVDALTRDLFKVVIKYNLGEEYLQYTPKISLGDTERRNFSQDSQAVASLFQAGYFTEEQLKYIDTLLQLPIREVGATRIGSALKNANP